jgi:hypothetical protein
MSRNLRLSDVETGDELEVHLDPATAERYRQALAAHHQQWLDAARRYGVSLVTIVAEELIRDWHAEASPQALSAANARTGTGSTLAELVEIGLLQAAP